MYGLWQSVGYLLLGAAMTALTMARRAMVNFILKKEACVCVCAYWTNDDRSMKAGSG